jgi:hypothetical protein
MKLFTFLTAAAAAVVVSAQAEPIADRERAAAAQTQAAQQRQVDQARDRCIANRGADCDTLEGLREWLLLDRSRAEAVLDRVSPSSPNASGGSSSITVNPSTPRTSPRNQ